MLNQKYQPWIYEEDVPKEALKRFLATKTLSGKKRKRKPFSVKQTQLNSYEAMSYEAMLKEFSSKHFLFL